MGWGVAAAFVAIIMVGWYLSTTAARLDRLNKRVETARFSLERQLQARLALAAELAVSGLLDPVSGAVLADAAHQARVAPADLSVQRAQAESSLTAVLAALFNDPADIAAMRSLPGGPEMADELDTATRRVAMSRRFLNDGVRANRDVRRQRVVRYFRLAGSSPTPQTFECNDTPPAGFGSR